MLSQESFREGWSRGVCLRARCDPRFRWSDPKLHVDFNARGACEAALSRALAKQVRAFTTPRVLLRVLYVDCHAVGQYCHLVILGVGLFFVSNLDRGFDVRDKILWFVNDFLE